MLKPPANSVIRLRGVRHNNLKNFDLDLPLHQLIVITGLSGSGKSSLAFDTLYAEGQRRYIETFSPYARQFFDRMDKPQVDSIEGIPPAIAIEQRNAVRSTRSTVGTMTEICDYMKMLWPHVAQLHCRQCGLPVRKDSPQQIWEKFSKSEGRSQKSEGLVTFNLPLSETLSLTDSLALISKQGYQRLLIGEKIVRLEDAPLHLAPRTAHLTVVQDRLKPAASSRARFVEACEQAYHFGKSKLTIWEVHPPSSILHPRLFSSRLHCAACDLEYREPSPALFSFNNPVGACPACKGFGRIISIDYDLAIPDHSLTLAEGVVRPWRSGFSAECQDDLMKFCRIRKAPTDVPFEQLPKKWRDWVINGDPEYGQDEKHKWPRAGYGVKGYFRWLDSKSYKMHVRVLLSRYRAYTPCPDCHGARFQPESLLYVVDVVAPRQSDANQGESQTAALCRDAATQLTLAGFYALPVRDAAHFIDQLAGQRHVKPSDPLGLVLGEVRSRLGFLNKVGLGYLTLDRPTRSLSGGETERVNLTTCLGTSLVNTLFVLDEPSVGLHPRDTDRLVCILQRLRDAGNTVVVVEHEASLMRAANQIVDLGPGHGATGGEVVFQGSFHDIVRSKQSLTGQYLSGVRRIEIPKRRPVPNQKLGARSDFGLRTSDFRWLTVTHVSRHNLHDLSVRIPLNRFVCITGVSGSGKTTLVREVLLPALEAQLKSQIPDLKSNPPKASERIEDEKEGEEELDGSRKVQHETRVSGHEHVGRVVLVDQSILGKTPRSNPAVYIGAFEDVRELFAQSEPAKQRGLNTSAFSFNSGQGQCERCRGAGFEKIEMQFLSDVFIRCPDCNGRRYRQHILEVKVESRRSSVAGGSGEARLSTLDSRPSTVSWSIADLLDATVEEVVAFLAGFADSKPAQRAVAALKLLQEVGLGYLRLGQPINTLSGGESQRLKLVRHLAEAEAESRQLRVEGGNEGATRSSRPSTLDARPILFLFDEPTTGLHFDDVRVLLNVFQRLVGAGHSVVVIEHNLDVIKTADWVIDLGPEAGDGGGQIVAQGTPEDIAACETSHTGRFLRELLGRESRVETQKPKTPAVQPLVASTLDSRPSTAICIHGAREHNLKNFSLRIPRDRLVVITGVSGSGKSTLAFDLLFAEGQRRFLDSMNVYARQFVEQLARPDVDLITGIPPTVSIEQRISRGGGKSTVATVTEIYHFIRLLFARLGTQLCPDCRVPVEAQTRDALGRRLQAELKRRGDLLLLAPVVKGRKGFHTDVAGWAAKHGYNEIRADGKIHDTAKLFRLDRFREHNLEIVIGVLERKQKKAGKPAQALIDETLKLGNGTLLALDNHRDVSIHSTEQACPECGRSFEPLDPKNFSYNSPAGWCPKCRGFGELFYLPDVDRGARAGAIEESWYGWQEGEREICPECRGARLNPVARAVRLKVGTHRSRSAPTIDTVSGMPVGAAFEFFRRVKFSGRAAVVARDILPEIRERLNFLREVGLGYLQLGRGSPTLSGGEAQRIRLAAQLGSNLSGVLYILDEPTIGLHMRDNERLLAALQQLKARGNSIVVVEHDEETMRRADYVIDLGPSAGIHGGQVVAAGTLSELMRHPESVTGRCLRQRRNFPSRGQRRPVSKLKSGLRTLDLPWLTVQDADKNNLRNLTVRFPLGRLVLVTGVSGSGKSTLVHECLLPALLANLNSQISIRKSSSRITNFESLKAVYEVDQSPIGRTPRSIPATYVGFFDDIRALFAQVPESRLRGYSPSRFSFNSTQGRCPQCQGAGEVKLEMHFLPPAFVRCETCGGTRFNRETLDIQYGGKNIAQVLELSVEEAMEFFASIPKVKRPLAALHDTGLDYLKLGQTSPTLSGGEAQRVKLVSHLLAGLREPDSIGRAPRRNLFILEEPTIGLHMADVGRLVEVLQRLVDAGHSVIVVEHNLDLIAEADWIVDLGPEAGDGGGRIVVQGTPEQVAQCKRSHTGRFLRKLLAVS